MPLHVALECVACEAVVQLLCVPEVPALMLIVCHGMLLCSEGLGMVQPGVHAGLWPHMVALLSDFWHDPDSRPRFTPTAIFKPWLLPLPSTPALALVVAQSSALAILYMPSPTSTTAPTYSPNIPLSPTRTPTPMAYP